MILEREFDYFIEHQDELVRAYGGRVVAIKDCRVVGVYDSEIQAVQEASKVHQLGTFLVQKCEPGIEAYTRIYHSRMMV